MGVLFSNISWVGMSESSGYNWIYIYINGYNMGIIIFNLNCPSDSTKTWQLHAATMV